jgi:hypothetical protein
MTILPYQQETRGRRQPNRFVAVPPLSDFEFASSSGGSNRGAATCDRFESTPLTDERRIYEAFSRFEIAWRRTGARLPDRKAIRSVSEGAVRIVRAQVVVVR